MIKKDGNGWKVDFYPEGKKGPRVRKRGFKARLDAVQFIRDYGRKESVRRERLSDLVKLWFDYHGHTLSDAKRRVARTYAICERLNDPRVQDFTASDWMEYRTRRLQQVNPVTVNQEQRFLSSVFSEMIRIGHLKTNPIGKVRQIRTQEREMTFLTIEQCERLLQECRASSNPHCWPVAMICLATGARWSEAESLTQSAFLPGKVLFRNTKNGKSRAVPIDPAIQADVIAEALPGPGRLFLSCSSAFRSAYGRCGFQTPRQLTHILRHTFASHFMMNGGDLLTLQRILGHANITMTMRYAHLAPDHLESAVRLSPLTAMASKD
ncbi:phage integrase [Marinobacter mangrovi]|uniref:phage integrase n=1 Tax=Marinobacter mangrovi TaxID=2803918 RepID=UPI00193497F4|nr:tyrosine-type recombinase/integrase [Marinobacter mangrovi]